MWLLLLQTLLSLTTLAVLSWVVREYIRARRQIQNLLSLLYTKPPRMQMDDLLEGLLAEETEGQAMQYLGKELSAEQVDSLGEDEVEKLYARYEARLGAAMTKTLGQAALQLYTAATSLLLPIPPENRQPLMADLETDPFVNHALSVSVCEVYHRYGRLLAPITAALTTAKYCRFGHQCPRRIVEDGGQECDDSCGDAHAGGDAHAHAAGDFYCGATVSTGATSATSDEGDGRDSADDQPVA